MHMSHKVSFLLGGLLLLFISSCTHDSIPIGLDIPTDSGAICFQEQVLPIMVRNCANSGCHNPSSKVHGLDYTTYSGILKSVKKNNASGSTLIKITRSGEMPPRGNPSLNSDQLAILTSWITQGALNTQDCSSLDCSSVLNVSYSTSVYPIIKNQCLNCHTARLSEAGYNFDTFTGVMKAVNNRSLLGSIKHSSGFVGMPYNSAKISDCEITHIETWIAEGAKNN